MAVPVTATMQSQIANLYIAILGRNPEPGGFAFWVDRLANENGTQAALNQITEEFGLSREFRETYGGQTTQAAIGRMYVNVLDRAADAGGLAFWTNYANNLINNGEGVVQALALTGNAIITIAQFNNTQDSVLIAAKNSAAIASGTSAPTTTYTLTTNIDIINGQGGNEVFIGDNATTQVADQLTGGLGTDTLQLYATTTIPTISGIEFVELISLTPGDNAVAVSFANNADVSQVTLKNLTTAIDTAKNFTVTLASGTSLNLNNVQAGDEAAGNVKYAVSSSVTTANIVLNRAGNAATSGNALEVDIDGTGVTTLNVNTTGVASRVALAGSAFSSGGIETINITGGQNLTASVAANNTSAKVTIAAGTTTGNLSLDLSATEAYVVTGGTGNDRFLTAGQDDFINGGTGANTVASASLTDGIATLNLTNTATGAFRSSNIQTFEYTGGGTTAQTLNASSILLPSVVNYEFSTNDFSYGTTAATSGANSSSGAVGTIGEDMLTITAQSNSQTFIFETNITGQKGGAGGSATVANSGGGSGGGGGDGLTIVAAVDTIGNTLNLVLAGVSIVGGTGGVGGAAVLASSNANGGAGGAGGRGLVATGFEFININSTGTTSTAANEFAGGASTGGGAAGTTGSAGAPGAAGDGITVSANTQFVITGANDMRLGVIGSNNTAVGVNAAGLSGDLTVTTGTAADIITGGSGNNTLTLRGGADTINISASTALADVITTTAATGTTATAFVTITGFTNSGTSTVGDRLDLLQSDIQTNVAGGTATGVANLTAGVNNGIMTFGGSAAASATLANLISAALSTNFAGSDNEVLAFQFSGNTYIVVNDVASAGFNDGDQVVELVGLTGVIALSNTASAANTIWVN